MGLRQVYGDQPEKVLNLRIGRLGVRELVTLHYSSCGHDAVWHESV